MPAAPTNTHRPVGARSLQRAMRRLPMTKPIDVRASWTPYWNSLAPSSRIAIGRSSTFQRPMAKNAGAMTTNSESSVGGFQIVPSPPRRLAAPTPTEAASTDSAAGVRMRSSATQPAAKTNVTESIQNAQFTERADAGSPAPAQPTAGEPNDA